MAWTPPDLNEVCPLNSELSSCSSFAYAYLALLAQLFGDSVDRRIQQNLRRSHYELYDRDNEIQGSEHSEFFFELEKHNETVSLSGKNNDVANNIDADSNGGRDKKKRDIKTSDEISGEGAREVQKRSNEEISKRREINKRAINEEEYDFVIVGAGSAGCVVANRLSKVIKWKVLLLEAGEEQPDVSRSPALAPALVGSSADWRYRTQPDGGACAAHPRRRLRLAQVPTRYYWRYRTQPDGGACAAHRGGGCGWPRGKVVGGSSVLNHMIYMRGSRHDYDEWAAAGNHGWSYHEVLPYFKKSENNHDIEAEDRKYHAVGGNLDVQRFPYVDKPAIMLVDAFEEMGLPLTDFNAENQKGTMIAQTTSLNGIRDSTNDAFIRNIRYQRTNLTVKPNSEATQILIDPQTKVAYGVKYIRNGIWHYAYANKEVIVSAGAINSPKLLMLSGIGPQKHLEEMGIQVVNDLNVGRNLQDHVSVDGLLVILGNATSLPVDKELIINELYKYRGEKHYDGPLSGTGAHTSVGFIQTQYSTDQEDVPDIQFHFSTYDVNDYIRDTATYLASRTHPLTYYDGITPRPFLLKPESTGHILLNTTDPFEAPLIYANYLSTARDVATMISAMKYVIRLEDTEAFRRYGAHYWREPLIACRNYIWGTDEYLECILRSYTATIYHPSCTCKMGPRWDREAVVDPRLRVYGVGNLRVVDASVMPSVTRSNTNAPTIMIAEKAADMIKGDWNNYR